MSRRRLAGRSASPKPTRVEASVFEAQLRAQPERRQAALGQRDDLGAADDEVVEYADVNGFERKLPHK